MAAAFWGVVWIALVLIWGIHGAPASTSRTAGVLLLALMPPLLALRSPAEVRSGAVLTGMLLLATGAVFGPTSGASVGTSFGALTAWSAIAIARSAPDPRERVVFRLVAALGIGMLLAPSTGPAGPRILGALISVMLGVLLGERLRSSARRTIDQWWTDAIARMGVLTLAVLGGVRTFVDIDRPAIDALLAVRRFASLVLPVGLGAIESPQGTLPNALPWLLPLIGGLWALSGTGRTSVARPPAVVDERRSRVPKDVVTLITVGIMGTLLLDLIALNWATRIEALGIRWPARHLETVLWGAFAVAVGATSVQWPTRRAWRSLASPAAIGGAILISVLLSEWRTDGAALRPSLLALPVAFAGIVALGRHGTRPVALGMLVAGLPALFISIAAGASRAESALFGMRSYVPGRHALLMSGERLVGVMPTSGQLGSLAGILVFAAVLSIRAPSTDRGPRSANRTGLLLGSIALALGPAVILLAEAKTVILALALGAIAPVALTRSKSLALVVQDLGPRTAAVLAVGAAVVAAPFVGAVVLPRESLRPEVWRLSIASLAPSEWLIGLGAQPLRMDRELHSRIESTWGAVHAHNQTVEFLLMLGASGLLLMFLVTAGLLAAGLRMLPTDRGWSIALVTYLLVTTGSGPTLTYFGHDTANLLGIALMASVVTATTAPRLVRLPDDPVTLPDALEHTWDAGHAAVVAPQRATLPRAVDRALAGELPLPSGTALVVPTSGSTGEPRAVVLTHDALAASTASSIAALGCRPGERWALALPLRHVAGLQVLARARALGTRPHAVAAPGDPHAIAAAADHAEHIALVPTQVVRCLDAGEDVVAALARFRSVLVGGGPLAPERITQARAAGIALTLSYGMTETCGGCVYDGRPLDGVTVDIDGSSDIEQRDAAGLGAPAEAPGRIRLRGPMLAAGYLDPTPEDAARFTDDGWFVTDDLGRIAPDGTLKLLGRVDAVINTGGVKVDPVAVEALLRSDAAVADALVLGVPDTEWGERVVAFVVPTDPSAPPTLERLRDVVGAALPTSHAPRELRRVDRIARDEMGKVSAAERARLSAG